MSRRSLAVRTNNPVLDVEVNYVGDMQTLASVFRSSPVCNWAGIYGANVSSVRGTPGIRS